jgi:alkylation response protein AidB-like acyl-CoA dehydrogenase
MRGTGSHTLVADDVSVPEHRTITMSALTEAIHILLNVHGAGSFAEPRPMQRYWRDANTAARHAGLNATVGYETYGKSLLGVEERIGGLV